MPILAKFSLEDAIAASLKDDKLLEDVLKKAWQNIQKGASLEKTLELGRNVEEMLYTVGFFFSAQGRYDVAVEPFRILSLFKPNFHPYALGFANCLQKLRRYREASSVYFVAFQGDNRDLGALYFAAECAYLAEFPQEAEQLCNFLLTFLDHAPEKRPEYTRVHAAATYLKKCVQENISFKPIGGPVYE